MREWGTLCLAILGLLLGHTKGEYAVHERALIHQITEASELLVVCIYTTDTLPLATVWRRYGISAGTREWIHSRVQRGPGCKIGPWNPVGALL
jgi:hypothetical protein